MGASRESDLVSIVIPAYNREKRVRDTLDSVWRQTYRPIEVILVDDGSTDDTEPVVRDWADRHSEDPLFETRLLTQDNQGAPVARNRGLKVAEGRFIQFLDSDDLLSETKLEEQARALRSSEGEDVAAFCETVFFEDGAEPKAGTLQEGRRMESSTDGVEWLTDLMGWDGYGGMVAPHAWLVPKQITDAVGPWREGLTTDQDGEYFSRVVLSSSRIMKTEGTAYYRVQRNAPSQSSRSTASDFRSLITSIRLKEERLLDAARTQQVDRVRAATARHLMQIAYQSYPTHPRISKVAERAARSRGADVDIPAPSSWKRKVLHRVVGWKGARIASHLYHG